MKTYTEKRFFEWHEDDVSVTLRSKSGSYGGGSESFVIAYGFDSYNQSIERQVAQPLRSHDGGDTTPKVIVDTLVFDESGITCPTNGNKPKWNDSCHSLTREAGRAVVIIKSSGFKPRNSKDARSIGYEEEKSPTLAADSGGCEVGILTIHEE